MKKLTLLAALLVFSGCYPYRYGPYAGAQPAARTQAGAAEHSAQKAAYDPGPQDLGFTVDVDPAFATDVASAGLTWTFPNSLVDMTAGMGYGLDLTTYFRARIFLREFPGQVPVGPFVFLGYWYAFEAPEVTFEDAYDSAVYTVEAAQILGFGMGYQWRLDPGICFHVMFGYHQRFDGGHLRYVSGDDPGLAPELFKEAQDWVSGDSPTATFGLEFRF
jgi:hypothetical protein